MCLSEALRKSWHAHKFNVFYCLRNQTFFDNKKRRREVSAAFDFNGYPNKRYIKTYQSPSLSTLTRLADGFGSKDNPTVLEVGGKMLEIGFFISNL